MEPNVVDPNVEQSPVPQPQPKRRRWPLIVGIVLGVLVLLGAGGYVVVTKVIGAVQQSSSQAAEAILGPLRDGEPERLWPEAAPLFKEQIPEAQWNQVLTAIDARFGRPLSWSVTGVGTKTELTPAGPLKSTTYSFRVTCEKGKANVEVTIDGEGRLLGLHFEPI